MASSRRERSKFPAWPLVEDHYDTFRNYQTGRRSTADYLVALGIPAGAGVLSWALDGHAGNIPDVLTAVAILTGLIFNVFVLIFDLTARAADKLPEASRELADQLADELRANVSYAVLVGLSLSGLLGAIVMFSDTDKDLSRLATVVVVCAGVHLLLTIFMVLKRVRAMFRVLRFGDAERLP